MSIRVLVADDERAARARLSRLLVKIGAAEVVGEAADGAAALAQVAALKPDVLFLDIEMPEMSGLDIAAAIQDAGPVVVFITAFSHYATRAFDVNAIDYVTKPFSDERFRASVERAKRRVRERRLGDLATQVAPVSRNALAAFLSLSAELRPDEGESAKPADGERYLQRLALKEGDRSAVVKAADIIWIQAEDYYVLIHSKQGRHMVRASLASLEQRLDPARFMRVHRTAIVNVDEVKATQDRGPLVLTLSNGAEVPVSRSRRQQVESIVRPRLR
jgi:two-component system LytT family response regulator